MSRIEHIVTIDGPSGSGKTSVAELLSRKLGFVFLNTGAMYRAATVAAMDAGVRMDPLDAPAAIAALRAAKLSLDARGVVLLDGRPVGSRLTADEVSANVSAISQVVEIRSILTAMQRAFGETAKPGLVAEGRDMATVVFTDARHRFYLEADLDERARRHLGRMTKRGEPAPPLEKARQDIALRDHKDSTRAVAPLKPAPGVVRLDTTAWTLERTVQEILDRIAAGGGV